MRILCGIFLLLTAGLPLYAQIEISVEKPEAAVAQESWILEDRTAEMTFEQARESENWKKNPRTDLNFGYTSSAFWIRFEFENRTQDDVIAELVSLVDDIRIFEDRDGWVMRRTGRWESMQTRDIAHRNFLFLLDAPIGVRKTVYFRFASSGALLLPITVYQARHFFANDHQEQYIYGLYFGVMLVMILYNGFLFLSVRDRSYLWYLLYILGFVCFQIGLWGFAHEFTDNHWLANRSIPLGICFCAIFACLFTFEFLALRTARLLYYLTAGAALSALLLGILGTFLPYKYIIKPTVYLGMICSGLFFGMGIYSWIRGYRPAKFFVIAWTALIGGVFVIGLRNLTLLPANFFTGHANLIGSAAEVILLSLALGDRINILKAEKESAQALAYLTQRRMAESFSRFVPRQFLQFLGKEDNTEVALGDAVQKRMTVLFADIYGFTTLSEKMSPSENFRFINAFLGRIGPIIRACGGFTDKYIGDALMALFPGNPGDAVRAAIDMRKALNIYNTRREAQGFDRIEVGIGIHTGNLMLGTVGEAERMDSTVISDAVNVASRLEHLTRHYGRNVLISGDSLEDISDRAGLDFPYVDTVQVRGRTTEVRVFTVDPAG